MHARARRVGVGFTVLCTALLGSIVPSLANGITVDWPGGSLGCATSSALYGWIRSSGGSRRPILVPLGSGWRAGLCRAVDDASGVDRGA
jgi:hypothetical protein